MSTPKTLEDITALVKKLRSPEGCPWDREQKASDIKSYLVGETYEVLDAIDQDSPSKIREELGDLFFLIVFLVDIFHERGDFDIYETMGEVADKMIRRHPHVFGNTTAKDTEEVKTNWKKIKAKEGKPIADKSILDGVPDFLPALAQAQLLTRKASTVGFDWPNVSQVISKIEEELGEFKKSIETRDPSTIEHELGDLFFSLVNLARVKGIDPEKALRKTNKKFTERFHYIEESLAHNGREIAHTSLEEMDRLWEKAKALER
jgi:tetrapyrrole methylase family protein/MazG family protein